MKKRKSAGIYESIMTIIYALLIALFVRTLAYEPFNIPSGSMLPTLKIGDYLFVSKGDYDNDTFGPVIFDSYLDVFDLDLNYQFGFNSENGPQWSTESMLIKDDVLYVLINLSLIHI